MLILLSASKKKIGSFVTPSPEIASVGVYSTDSSAFKYGNFSYTVYPSFKKEGGAFVGGAGTDVIPSIGIYSVSASGFTMSATVSPSAIVTYQDAGAVYYTMTPEAAFKLSSEKLGLLLPVGSPLNALTLGYEPISVLQTSSASYGSFMTVYNVGATDDTQLYSPYTTSTMQQTLSFQPESF